MKIPRDISGIELAGLLKIFGYSVTRQTGSHIRLTTNQKYEHHITIPAHNPLKIGTLNSILNEIAHHFGKSKSKILDEILG